jgi:hypothetical protein
MCFILFINSKSRRIEFITLGGLQMKGNVDQVQILYRKAIPQMDSNWYNIGDVSI